MAHSKFIQILIDTIISRKDFSDPNQSSDNTLLTLGLLINIIEKGSKINHILKQYGIFYIYTCIYSLKIDTKNTLLGLVTVDQLINTFNEWKDYSYNVSFLNCYFN